jgi:cytochrome c peroxidase
MKRLRSPDLASKGWPAGAGLAATALLLVACEGGVPSRDEPSAPTFTEEELEALSTLSPAVLPAPPRDVTNDYADDARAAAFGQRLFFTPLFSGRLLDGDNNLAGGLGRPGETGKVSCASCHVPDAAFTDTRSPSQQISLAAGWGKRKAPSLLDIGHAKVVLWDGRRDALYNQVFGPIESPVEMNSSRLYVAQQVFVHFDEEYEAVFGELPPLDDEARFPPISDVLTGCEPDLEPEAVCEGAFHGSPGDQAEYDGMTDDDQHAVTRVVVNVGKAIAAYERLLTCGTSRFDAWMRGDAKALSASEQRGAQVFVQADCIRCHSGPFMSDQAFHNVGLAPASVASGFTDRDDRGALEGMAEALADELNSKGPFSDGYDGRLPDKVDPAWDGAFRTPTLRCVSQRPSFFHTGQVTSLAAVVDFFDAGGHAFGFYGTKEIEPLDLSDQDKSDLVAFLEALDGPGAAADLRVDPAR